MIIFRLKRTYTIVSYSLEQEQLKYQALHFSLGTPVPTYTKTETHWMETPTSNRLLSGAYMNGGA